LYPYFDVGGFTYGGNVCCESVHDPEAVDVSARLCGHLGLSGLVVIEFRREPPGNRLILMKVDPRVVGMTALCTAIGFDVPTAIYRLYTGQPVAVAASYPEGVRWVWEKPYVLGLFERYGAGVWKQIPAAVSTLAGATALGVWSASDPMPFMWNAAGGVRSQVRKRFLRERGKHAGGPASLR
jgi:predicted ATP-grasp superfamily ATP-dependent carboligase